MKRKVISGATAVEEESKPVKKATLDIARASMWLSLPKSLHSLIYLYLIEFDFHSKQSLTDLISLSRSNKVLFHIITGKYLRQDIIERLISQAFPNHYQTVGSLIEFGSFKRIDFHEIPQIISRLFFLAYSQAGVVENKEVQLSSAYQSDLYQVAKVILQCGHKITAESALTELNSIKTVKDHDEKGKIFTHYIYRNSNITPLMLLINLYDVRSAILGKEHSSTKELKKFKDSVLELQLSVPIDTPVILSLHILDLKTEFKPNQNMISYCKKELEKPISSLNIISLLKILNYLKKQGKDIKKTCSTLLLQEIKQCLPKSLDVWDSKASKKIIYDFQIKVKLLLNHGADLEGRDEEGLTPLMLVCNDYSYLNCADVEFLIDHGADIFARDADGNMPIHHLCSSIEAYDYSYEDCDFPLFADILDKIIKLGCDVNTVNKEGNSPLMVYLENTENDCYEFNLDVIKFFISRGADLNLRNRAGVSATMMFLSLIPTDSPQETIGFLNFLRSQGASLCSSDFENSSSIIYLLRGELYNAETVLLVLEFLLNQGVPLFQINRDSESFLHYFMLENKISPTAKQLLLKINKIISDLGLTHKHALLNQESKQGLTPLMHAVQRKTHIGVQILIWLGANPNYHNRDGNSALMMLIENFEHNVMESKKIVSFLIEHGADINAVNKEGKTVVMIAKERYEKLAEAGTYDLDFCLEFVRWLQQLSENQRYFKKSKIITGHREMMMAPESDEVKQMITFYTQATKKSPAGPVFPHGGPSL